MSLLKLGKLGLNGNEMSKQKQKNGWKKQDEVTSKQVGQWEEEDRSLSVTKFRKKPVVIEATQWFKNGDHPDDASDGSILKEGLVVRYFCRPDVPDAQLCSKKKCSRHMGLHGWIDTSEGGHIVCPGDWIITGVKGERYPCKPDIFELTYEAVKE